MAKGKRASSAAASNTAAAATPATGTGRTPTSRPNTANRMLIMIGTGALVAFFAGFIFQPPAFLQRTPSTPTSSTLTAGRYNLTCLDSYPEIGHCSPPQTCGRILVDDFLTFEEVDQLRGMAALGMSFGSGSGGPTIFDAATGAASKGEAFIDAFAMMDQAQTKAMREADAKAPRIAAATQPDVDVPASESAGPDPTTLILSYDQLALYRSTARRIQDLVSREFGVRDLYLTSPSFFSRITPSKARTEHDEYWHEHVDRKQYGSFMYTALVYLSSHNADFEGGEFVFVDKDAAGRASTQTVLPARGRMMAFTSGAENVHYVSRVTSGMRHALTIAFTCDKKKSVEDTIFKKADAMLLKQADWTARQQVLLFTNESPMATN